MADDVELMDVVYKIILETFKIESPKHLQQEEVDNVVNVLPEHQLTKRGS